MTKKMILFKRNRFVKRYRLITFCLCAAVLFLYYSGLYMYLLEESYHRNFSYPLMVDVAKLVAQFKANRKPYREPINTFNYSFIISSSHKCRNALAYIESIKLLYVVKSALDNFEKRRAIRETWGWEERFSDVAIRRVFLLGIPGEVDPVLQLRINQEQDKYRDLVQAAFVDSYFNNTIKFMMGLNWTVSHCSKAEYVMFVDDDYYVSTKNVLRYLRKPQGYPEYLMQAQMAPKRTGHVDDDNDQDRKDGLLRDAYLFVGYKFPSSKPHRIKSSKWYITLDEYRFNRFPPYVTAGAYLMSMQTVQTFLYVSLYTVPFRFDDIYMGILAKKADIEPMHNAYFFFDRPYYSRTSYKYYIAAHGFGDPRELVEVWNEQRTLGNA